MERGDSGRSARKRTGSRTVAVDRIVPVHSKWTGCESSGAFTLTNSPCNRMSRNVRKEPMSVWVGMRSRLRMSGSNLKKGAVAGNESSPAFVTVKCDETGRIRTSARKRTGGLTVTDVREEFDHLKEQDEKARALSLRPTAPPIG